MSHARGILVHGIYSREGETNVSNMQAPLEDATGMEWVLYEYGFTSAFMARFTNNGHAIALADMMVDGDIVVGHSNGAAIIDMAVNRHGAKPGGIVYIQPALDRWRMAGVPWGHVYHNDEDDVVWLASLLPGNLWGDMGRVGYIPKDGRYEYRTCTPAGTNVSQFDTLAHAQAYGMRGVGGHTNIFRHPHSVSWGHFIGNKIMRSIKGEAF